MAKSDAKSKSVRAKSVNKASKAQEKQASESNMESNLSLLSIMKHSMLARQQQSHADAQAVVVQT